jgi:hypothetical protein
VVAIVLVAEELERLDGKPRSEEDGGENTVDDDESLFLSHHLESNSAVDDTEGEQDAAPPDMRIADNATATSRHEVRVVHPAQNGLDRQQADNNCAENGVRVIEKLEWKC